MRFLCYAITGAISNSIVTPETPALDCISAICDFDSIWQIVAIESFKENACMSPEGSCPT